MSSNFFHLTNRSESTATPYSSYCVVLKCFCCCNCMCTTKQVADENIYLKFLCYINIRISAQIKRAKHICICGDSSETIENKIVGMHLKRKQSNTLEKKNKERRKRFM